MLSTSDLLALVFGIISAVLAAIAIVVARKTRMLNHVEDIEAHSSGVAASKAAQK